MSSKDWGEWRCSNKPGEGVRRGVAAPPHRPPPHPTQGGVGYWLSAADPEGRGGGSGEFLSVVRCIFCVVRQAIRAGLRSRKGDL